MNVLVLEAQVPFVRGGAEIHVRQLRAALETHGYAAEIVSVPFTDTPHAELLGHAAAWRLLNLERAGGQSVDLVIATKFPTYFARHPRKVAWVIHQHRAAYDLCGTPFSDFAHTEADVGLRKRLVDLDTRMLRECTAVFANARNTANRLRKYNGVVAEPLYHPPKLSGRLKAGSYGDYILTVTRLEHIKRVNLAIEALRSVDPPTRLVVAGEGTARPELEAQARTLGLSDRVTLLGRVSDEQLIALYAGALAVVFTPYDEDYGYVTLEAFLSHKPVITASDSGGTLELITDGVNGLVVEPRSEALASGIIRLAGNRRAAASLGDAGYEVARTITWNGVVERLVGAAEGQTATTV